MILPSSRPLRFILLVFVVLFLAHCGEPSGGDPFQEGIRLTEAGDYEKAKEAFRKAIAQRPTHAKAYNGLGGLYNLEKDYDQAVAAFKKAYELDPTYHEALYGLAFTYETMGKQEEAEKIYKDYRRLKQKYDDAVAHEERQE